MRSVKKSLTPSLAEMTKRTKMTKMQMRRKKMRAMVPKKVKRAQLHRKKAINKIWTTKLRMLAHIPKGKELTRKRWLQPRPLLSLRKPWMIRSKSKINKRTQGSLSSLHLRMFEMMAQKTTSRPYPKKNNNRIQMKQSLQKQLLKIQRKKIKRRRRHSLKSLIYKRLKMNQSKNKKRSKNQQRAKNQKSTGKVRKTNKLTTKTGI